MDAVRLRLCHGSTRVLQTVLEAIMLEFSMLEVSFVLLISRSP